MKSEKPDAGNEDYGSLEAIWGEFFRAADADWFALIEEHEQNTPQLTPGMVWQQRKVKRGKRFISEMVQVPNLFLQMNEERMRKTTLAGSNPKGRGMTLSDADKNSDQEKLNTAQKFVDVLLEPLNRVAQTLEDKWGYDRLPGLVPIEMAERFATAAQKLSEAVFSGDIEQIKQRAEVMRRGWLKLDETAEAEGHEGWQQQEVWEGRRPDGKTFLLVKDKATAIQKHRDTGVGVWTLEEIGRLLYHFDSDGFTQSLKEEFAASLVSINAKEPSF